MKLFKFKFERVEKIFACVLLALLAGSLIYALFITLCFIFNSGFPNILPIKLRTNFSQLRLISESTLRFFGILLMLITLFEFFRRIREYLPEFRPNPRSLLASFGIVITTSLMASILIFANLRNLTDNVANLLSVGIVMGIGVAALIFVYKNIPHVLSKMWTFARGSIVNSKFCSPTTNRNQTICWEVNGFIECFIKLREGKKDSKAIKAEVYFGKLKGEIIKESVKVFQNRKKIKELRIDSDSFYWVTAINKSETLRYEFKFYIKDIKKNQILCSIEDEDGRDITYKQEVFGIKELLKKGNRLD